MLDFEAYTDGACSRNPGPGGYAVILLKNGKKYTRVYGGDYNTSNNRMELTAVLRAMQNIITINKDYFLSNKFVAKIYSDSAYCLNPINENWLEVWKNTNWKTSHGKDVKNRDLWEKIYDILEDKRDSFVFIKVKGHSGNKYNEEADKLARDTVDKFRDC